MEDLREVFFSNHPRSQHPKKTGVKRVNIEKKKIGVKRVVQIQIGIGLANFNIHCNIMLIRSVRYVLFEAKRSR